MKFKNIITGFAVMSLGALLAGSAEARISTIKLPLQTYAFKKVDCGLSFNKPDGSKYWIDPKVDLVKVTRYSGTWAQGTYPNSKGVAVTRYFDMNNLLYNPNYSNWNTSAIAATSVYRSYFGSETIGSIPNREPVEVVSEYNGRYQVIYVLANRAGFKMGWVPTSCIKKDLVLSVASGAVYAATQTNNKSNYESKIGQKVAGFNVDGMQCTVYARKRAAEALGISETTLYNKAINGNAKDVYTNTSYQKGSEPRSGSLACWTNSGAGHIVYVEYYDASTQTIYYSHTNSPYYGKNGCLAKMSLSSFKLMNKSYNGSVFQGFVYLSK